MRKQFSNSVTNCVGKDIFKKEKQVSARCPWLTNVILATQEAEIRRIAV
jgi:hypothetical protein